jgi:hypothetical protein
LLLDFNELLQLKLHYGIKLLKKSNSANKIYKYVSHSIDSIKNQIVTLRPAVKVYERLKAHMAKSDLAGPNDYLFLPTIKDRAIAGRLISQHFNKVLNAAGMKQGSLGQQRSLYSLRHTSIMFRLLYGNGIDLLTLARNARTSVQMIEKFYASNLTSEMNIGLIQSRRSMH